MSDQNKEAKIKARETYNSAADHFDDYPLGFWDRYGKRTVERLYLKPGMVVLDVCCGTGASAIPAAQRVGASGNVIGVDLSERLLELGQRKAAGLGLNNMEFRVGDMENLGLPGNHFDAVICVFGIFFIPDMEKQVRELWRMVKPGGKLAITTWGPRFLAPAYENWKEEIEKERPDLYRAYNPWDRITDVKSLTKLMRDGGTSNIEVVEEEGKQPLSNAEDWWIIVLGTGLRWTIDQLSLEAAQRVKQANLKWLVENTIDDLETNVIYAVATKDRS
jgi:ubiquinone/menaquinone biosynthesis C-methylase UbiE